MQKAIKQILFQNDALLLRPGPAFSSNNAKIIKQEYYSA